MAKVTLWYFSALKIDRIEHYISAHKEVREGKKETCLSSLIKKLYFVEQSLGCCGFPLDNIK